ncbi:NRDE family protein [Planctobacterium marinum]|uniref:NRDE family protein n=1 Tax=Planctobacterium marinum TaxID=1631968 RepID=UPI001E2B9906|nr:NRDE family protein [Planctobacterium marinum]MCC2607307.1 NRDE family protein [Planctobacterium marinum]
MCILFIAVKQHPNYPLIIAANRDEFYQRPTSESHFWEKCPDLLAGQDLEAGGTWMGVTKGGFISALTNIRAPHLNRDDADSRGRLVLDYLSQPQLRPDYVQRLHQQRHHYNGYNLLFGRWNDLAVYNNHEDSLQFLSPGFYGLSNANLNSPWPKINKGVQALKTYCQQQQYVDSESLLALLRNEEKAADHLLPQTGIPEQWEKQLSSIFIQSEGYGTRTSTLFWVDTQGDAMWHERTFNPQGQITGNKTEHLLQFVQ